MSGSMKKNSLTRRSFVKFAGVACAASVSTVVLGSCSSRRAEEATSEPSTPSQEGTPQTSDSEPSALTQTQAKSLVAYFSYPETDKTEGLTEEEENSVVVVDGQAVGNTQFVAQIIARETDADEFRILSTRSYPADHDGLISQAREEINAGDRPPLAEPIPDLTSYDTLFIGYPIWWYELPPAVMTFLETAEVAGKQIYLFNTHGGSGASGTVADITALLSDATVSQNNFVVSRTVVADCEPDVIAWLDELGV